MKDCLKQSVKEYRNSYVLSFNKRTTDFICCYWASNIFMKHFCTSISRRSNITLFLNTNNIQK